jgi:membrane protease YdiL (CAAX protease family)
MLSSITKKRLFYYLLGYILLLLATIAVTNFYFPVLKIKYLNHVVEKIKFFYLIHFFLFVIFLPRKLFKWSWKELNITNKKILSAVVLLLVWFLLFYLANPLIFATLWQRISMDYFIVCLITLISATFVEELIFREILFKKIRLLFNSRHAILFSVVLSSLIFALAHVSRAYVEYNNLHSGLNFIIRIFIGGIFSCLIYYYTKNFILIVIIHMMINFDYEFLSPLHFKSFHINEASFIFTILIALLVILYYSLHRVGTLTKKIVSIGIMASFLIIVFNNVRNKNIIEYYEDGVMKVTLEDDSIMTLYDRKGKITAFGKFENGEKVGNWIEYYPNGKIMWQGKYKSTY